jgi:glycosyltransferase involved in cell wall biosynthesis
MLYKRKYNILYTTSFARMTGGGQWSLYYLIKHLNKEIFHPIVLCPGEGELAEEMRSIGAEMIYLDVGRIRSLNPLVVWKMISFIKQKQIDLIHTDSTTETFYAGIAARMMRIPLVWHIRVSEREWFLDRVLSLLSTRLILVANAISPRFAWLWDHHKTVVVHNGIDLEEFDNLQTTSSIREEFNVSEDTVLLGCLGRIEKRKGQEYLVSAMRYIDNVKLLLVGGGEERYINEIKMLCNELGISDRVFFAGSRADIPSVLKEIDMLVLPSISGEGFPRVLLEAMAARRPVIATDDAGNPEAVEDGLTGYIVPTANIAALAEKIKELVADKKKRTAMGQAGRKRLQKLFTIQQHVSKVQGLYLGILAKEHKPGKLS